MTKLSRLQEENQMLRVQLLKHKLDLIVLALTPESRRARRIIQYWKTRAGRREDSVFELSNIPGNSAEQNLTHDNVSQQQVHN
ncbi:MAG: hypothetical protein GT597_13800 [Bacteroidales bacterium]|jgi:hypothetical protein|nr:hypothetical protein [Bacteroidales bacterium]